MAENPDVAVIATGGMPSTRLHEIDAEQPLAVSAWDLISGDVKPAANILIYDEAGDHPGLMAAELASKAGSKVEVMTPDRTFAPDIMGMNLVPYMRALQDKDVTFTVARRLEAISRDGNRLKARIGTDYSSHADEKSYDQIVVNYGTRPLDELYFDLREASVNRGEITQAELLAGKPQTIVTNPEGSFRLFRIGDAVSSRNIHAAIYDALRLMKDI